MDVNQSDGFGLVSRQHTGTAWLGCRLVSSSSAMVHSRSSSRAQAHRAKGLAESLRVERWDWGNAEVDRKERDKANQGPILMGA